MLILNRFIGLIFFLLFLPVYFIIFLTILLFDGFPILFKQDRFGQNNSTFSIYKFRTMKNNIGDIPTHLVGDSKMMLSKTGLLLRKLSFDELPQIFNIIKGDMVFVGPRPALHNQYDWIELRTEKGIHKLKPGVTGWAQVNGRDELSIPEKVNFENHYLHHKSFLLDFKIILITVVQIFIPKGVSH